MFGWLGWLTMLFTGGKREGRCGFVRIRGDLR